MRLHRLQIEAFGPFAERVDIDFDELTENGLFLLHGPTGAGKTSVLDAICYALYASVPGARQEAKRLRSDHADAHVAPEVVLEFTARGRRFEVTRSPEWQRPVKRGTGTTREAARSMLREKVDGEWLEGTRDHKETALEITALLGMKVEQFTRVVLLPQGDFANFLKAESRQRAELLQQLFATDRFASIESQLADRHAAAEKAVAGMNNAIDELVARTRQSADGVAEAWATDPAAADSTTDSATDGTPASPPERGEGAETARAYIDSTRRMLEAELSTAQDSADTASDCLTEARARRDTLAARAGRHARLTELRRDQEAFDDCQKGREDDRAALAEHRRAAVVRSRLEAADAAAAALARSTDALADAVTASGRTADSELPTEIDDLRATLVRLDDLRRDEQGDSARRTAIKDLTARIDGDSAQLEADESTSDSLTEKLVELQATRDGLRDLAAQMTAHAAEAERAESALSAARQADSLRSEVEHSEDALRGATDTAQRLRDGYLEVREQRLAGMAGELAAQLQDGESCPVCGSPDHPSPAVRTPGAVDASVEKAAEAESAKADAARQLAQDDVSGLRTRLSDAVARSGDSDTAAALQLRDDAATRARTSADARSRVDELSDEIGAAEAEVDRLGAGIRQCGQAIASAERDLHDLEALTEQFEEKRRAIVGDETVNDAVDNATRRKTALERLQATAADVRRATESADSARHTADEAAVRAGFAGQDAVRTALLDDSTEEEMRDRQTEALSRAAELRTRAGEPELAIAERERLEGTGTPTDDERTSAADAFAVAESAHRGAVERRAVAKKALHAVTAIAAEFDEATRDADSLQHHFRLTYRLSELARGRTGNDLRMSLSTYVLAARLEAVADAASSRLLAMSEGRYSIRHTDARAGHGRLSGLGLEVLDSHTGTSRDPRTLSGGESFQASLALALGLADVVQAESGGVDLETLFIDEGFGSLDEQSLELVLDTLDGLRSGGRAVGVISHVREMKDRIMSSIEIEKTPHGSRVGTVRVS